MKAGLVSIMSALVVAFAAAGVANADEPVESAIPFNAMADGPMFRLCHIGAYPRPYESDKLHPGGRDYQRLGGLAWELDATDGAPHICGRSMPGFRHFESFMQAGPRDQALASFDLGLVAPPGAEGIKPVTARKNWTNHTLTASYKDGGRDASYSLTVSRSPKL